MSPYLSFLVLSFLSALAFVLFLNLWHASALHAVRSRFERDRREQKKILAASERELAAVKAALDAASAAHAIAAGRWRVLCDMETTWLGSGLEEPAKKLLRENMWVLQPDMIVIGDRIDWERSVRNAVRELFGEVDIKGSPVWRTPFSDNPCDIAAVVTTNAALGTPRTLAGDEVLLLVEAKRPGQSTLNEDALQQVLSYASNFRKAAPDKLFGRRIECLLVGATISDNMHDVVVRWDSDGEAPTVVRLATWRTLFERAKRVCEMSGLQQVELLGRSVGNTTTLPIAAE